MTGNARIQVFVFDVAIAWAGWTNTGTSLPYWKWAAYREVTG